MCDHHLHDGPLTCVRTDPHQTGHVYNATAGPDLDQPPTHANGDIQ